MSDVLLLDTHALVWFADGDRRLGDRARDMAEAALGADTLTVSAISFWEIAMLLRAGRLRLAVPAETWRQGTLERGILELHVTGQIGIAAGQLEGLPGDPADRIIVATAVMREATLLTADERILGWGGNVQRHDARQ